MKRWCGAVFCVVMALMFACSRAPANDVLKAAIAESLAKQVPVSWSGSLLGGKNAKLELIEIQKVGKFKKELGYWPVKARVKGTCEADLIVKTETREFDRVGDFHVFQDDYGGWTASIEIIQ